MGFGSSCGLLLEWPNVSLLHSESEDGRRKKSWWIWLKKRKKMRRGRRRETDEITDENAGTTIGEMHRVFCKSAFFFD